MPVTESSVQNNYNYKKVYDIILFSYLRGVKDVIMKHGEIISNGFAGYKKSPVAPFAPDCFAIDTIL